MAKKISGSVGKGGKNARVDTAKVQSLLNRHVKTLQPLAALKVDGLSGNKTEGAITSFQKRVVKLNLPDGRVDPGGKTITALTKTPPTEAIPGAPPAAGNMTGGGAADPNAGSGLPAAGGGDGMLTPTRTETRVAYSSSIPTASKLVSNYAFSVIHEALRRAEMSHAVITSTVRTAHKQAQLMYDNAKIDYQVQYNQYYPPGKAVLAVFKANEDKPRDEVIALMEAEVEARKAANQRVSSHCVSPSMFAARNTFDIGVNSTRAVAGPTFNIINFTTALVELKSEGYIHKVVDETKKSNNCWHVEIVPGAKALT